MNFIDELKSYGVIIEPEAHNIITDNKFVLTRDANTLLEYMYVVRYNKFPSTLHFNFSKTKFKELVQYLVASDFILTHVKCSQGRYTNNSAIFRKVESSMTLEMVCNNFPALGSLQSILGDRGGSGESEEEWTVTVCFDSMIDHEIPFKMKEMFIDKDLNDNKGKVLLFEKDEYSNIVLTPHKVTSYDLDIKENYNDDFQEVHAKIDAWAKDFSGRNNKLVLLHGEPGTGKTNYIKHLLTSSSDVKKIYIPPFFVSAIADPGFFPVIKREKESLLIIEDAEKILINRDENGGDASVVSILLNLCDGIMADVLNFKIIATFNTDESRIDKALKRKGRMYLKYNFDKLTADKTSHLYAKVNNGEEAPQRRMSLAEIYNDNNEFGAKKEERRVGFGV
jgi:hypothetical protein